MFKAFFKREFSNAKRVRFAISDYIITKTSYKNYRIKLLWEVIILCRSTGD